MKHLPFLLSMFVFSFIYLSCSSIPVMETEHLDDIPSWVYEEGRFGNKLVAVGEAEGAFNGNHIYVKRHAIFDAKSKLLSGAPANFKSVVMRAMEESTAGGKIDFSQMESMVQEVHGTVGFEVDAKKVVCVRVVREGDFLSRKVLVCYAKVSLDYSKLVDAYAYTLEKKYGVKDTSQFKSLMQQKMSDMIISN